MPTDRPGKQGALLSISRSSFYYELMGETERNLDLMRLMLIYQKLNNTSRLAKGHKIYPDLLRGLRMDRPNRVWRTDITYLPFSADLRSKRREAWAGIWMLLPFVMALTLTTMAHYDAVGRASRHQQGPKGSA